MSQFQRRHFLVLAGATLGYPLLAFAQSRKHSARIAVFGEGRWVAAKHLLVAFKDEMTQRGWRDGENVEYILYEGQNDPIRIDRLAAELVAQKPDIIYVTTAPVAVAVKKHTSSLPIVFSVVPYPVEAGLVASLAKPGGNATGATARFEGLWGRRLQLFREIVPSIRRIAVLYDPSNLQDAQTGAEVGAAAKHFAIEVQPFAASGLEDIKATFAAIRSAKVDALIIGAAQLFFLHRKLLADLGLEQRMPTLSATNEGVEAGLLFGYQTSISGLFRKGARYVDQILRGAKPADLPVEQPTTFQFWINAGTAKALGLKIAPSTLLRADRVIE